MTTESKPVRRARRQPRVPAFYPVPTRGRRDGWTLQKQTDFLGFLAETGSVMGACEAVGMSRNSAYKLRARPNAESFAAAWDAALGTGLLWAGSSDEAALTRLRERVASAGGIAPVVRGPGGLGDVPLPAPAVQRRLKDAFDPPGILAPGRAWGC